MTTSTTPGLAEYAALVADILDGINHAAANNNEPWPAARARRTREIARMHAALDRAAVRARTAEEIAHDNANTPRPDHLFGSSADDVRIPHLTAFIRDLIADGHRTIAVFRNAAQTTYTRLRAVGADDTDTDSDSVIYTIVCEGCGWAAGPGTIPQFSDNCHLQPHILAEQNLRAAENLANKHAAGCTQLPRDQWPGTEAQQ